LSQGGFETGISTIAAPVFNDQHHVVAAISITVPAQQVDPELAQVLLSHVQSAAAQLTERISHFQKPSST